MSFPPAVRPSPALAPSAAEAAALERELLEDYRFGRQQLVELCGQASAVAVAKAFPLPSLPRKQRTVLVVCGPEQNGAVGLVCARHLRVFVSRRLPRGGRGWGWRERETPLPPRRDPAPGAPELRPLPRWRPRSRPPTRRRRPHSCPPMRRAPAPGPPRRALAATGVRAHHLLPHAPAGAAAPGPDHAVREDGHPVPVVPARRGAAHQRRLRAGGGRRAGPRRGSRRGRGALCPRAGRAEAAVHPAREPGRPLRHAPAPCRRVAARPGRHRRELTALRPARAGLREAPVAGGRGPGSEREKPPKPSTSGPGARAECDASA
ncbi:yjeF N-terminal domain-containing protein 3 isoform 1-T1 [Thomomys bottae]